MRPKSSFLYKYQTEIFLFLTAFFIRFPFFFRDYVDKDESTFILMGQSIADGHLPYDHLWDLKPPLLFYFFALIEKVFPHSFVAIRFFGVIIVFLSAIVLMKIVKQAQVKNAFLIALGYVILSSEFGSLQGVMSEHFAVLFMLIGFLFFLKDKSLKNLLIAEIAFGCSILCKLNYAYGIAALILVYAIENKKHLQRLIKPIFYLALGIVLPVIIIMLPFVLSNKLNLFINSVFLAPLEYGRATQVSMIEKLKSTWWIILLGLVVSILALRQSGKNRSFAYYCIAILMGTIYTFYSSGIVNGHYLVQIYPFLLLLVLGVLLQKSVRLRLSIAALIVVLISFESIAEYYKLVSDKLNHSSRYERSSFIALNELKKRKLNDDKIFFADYHIDYWLLNQYPLTKSTTHPSNISRSYLFKYFGDSSKTSLDELKYLMEIKRPDIIVSQSPNLEFFPDSSSENDYFRETLNKNFDMIFKDRAKRVYIWQRTNR